MERRRGVFLFQFWQLSAVSLSHFVADIFPGLMHSILPEIQSRFELGVTKGGVLLTIFLLSCNGVQLLMGHLRADKRRPFFLYVGPILTACLCLMIFVPAGSGKFFLLLVLAVVCGCGVGSVHPEGLRAIHTMRRIPANFTTAMYMVGGIGGFALGGWLSAGLVERFGFRSLGFLGLFCVLAVVVVRFLRVRLSIEKNIRAGREGGGKGVRVGFGTVMLMATLAAISSAVLVWIIPQRLNELGFSLTFGGFTVMLFSVGGGAGAFLWAYLAHKKGDLLTINAALVIGVPFMISYIAFVRCGWAVWLFFAASFCTFGVYPLMVTMARYTKGFNLGRRMGFMVGGTWLISSFFPMALAPVAREFGTETILMLAPVGYVLAAFVGLYSQRRNGLSETGGV